MNAENLQHIGERLRGERARLGLSQVVFADACGVNRSTLATWEKGEQSPTAAVLAMMAGLGVDVLYVVTGQRAGTAAPAPALSRRAQALVENYEATGEDGKKIIEAAAFAAAKPGAAKRAKAA